MLHGQVYVAMYRLAGYQQSKLTSLRTRGIYGYSSNFFYGPLMSWMQRRTCFGCAAYHPPARTQLTVWNCAAVIVYIAIESSWLPDKVQLKVGIIYHKSDYAATGVGIMQIISNSVTMHWKLLCIGNAHASTIQLEIIMHYTSIWKYIYGKRIASNRRYSSLVMEYWQRSLPPRRLLPSTHMNYLHHVC